MQVNPYLVFNGQCEAAFKFYEKSLGGKIKVLMTHAEMPAEYPVSPEHRDKILHAALVLGDQLLMGSDAPPDHFKQPQGFSVALQIDDPVEAERIFNAFAEKGKVTMPFQQTFWAYRFGMVVDQFDIPWMINCEQAK